MSGWKLDPAGIQGVLLSVNAEAEALGTDLVGTEGAPIDHGGAVVDPLAWALELTAPVTGAVNAALSAQAESMQTISNGIAAAQLGVLNATMAYNQGNEEMAATAQAEAIQAADSGNFTWFENNGVK